jgi:hypothetical protein
MSKLFCFGCDSLTELWMKVKRVSLGTTVAREIVVPSSLILKILLIPSKNAECVK